MKFTFIEDLRKEQDGMPSRLKFSVSFMFRMLGVSRAGFYLRMARKISVHAQRDAELTRLIVTIDTAQKGRYGIDRIHGELARQGSCVRRVDPAAGDRSGRAGRHRRVPGHCPVLVASPVRE